MRPGESKTSPRRLAAIERQARGLQLRAQGLTYKAVADALGWKTRQAAHRAISLALARTTRRVTPNYVEIAVASARVDALLVPIMRQALTGDPLAITLALAVMDRQAQLLTHLRG